MGPASTKVYQSFCYNMIERAFPADYIGLKFAPTRELLEYDL